MIGNGFSMFLTRILSFEKLFQRLKRVSIILNQRFWRIVQAKFLVYRGEIHINQLIFCWLKRMECYRKEIEFSFVQIQFSVHTQLVGLALLMCSPSFSDQNST